MLIHLCLNKLNATKVRLIFSAQMKITIKFLESKLFAVRVWKEPRQSYLYSNEREEK